MQLEKRIYRRAEVEKMLSACTNAYEKTLGEQRERIADLISQTEELQRKNELYEKKEDLIVASIKNATDKANQIVADADVLYALSLQNLIAFQEKLDDFIKKHLKNGEKVDFERVILAREEINKIVNSNEPPKEKVKDAEKVFSAKQKQKIAKKQEQIKEKTVFNPEKIIKDYIAVSDSDRFNIDDVINPKDIRLEELCKEMGLNGKKS